MVPTPEGEVHGYEQEQDTYNESLRRCELSDLTAREDRRVEVTVARGVAQAGALVRRLRVLA